MVSEVASEVEKLRRIKESSALNDKTKIRIPHIVRISFHDGSR